MRTQEPSGLLSLPRRISYFGGDVYFNGGARRCPAGPSPSYTVVTTMAWVSGGWMSTTCPDLLCEQVNAWRIDLSPSSGAPPHATPPAAPSESLVPAGPAAPEGPAPRGGEDIRRTRRAVPAV